MRVSGFLSKIRWKRSTRLGSSPSGMYTLNISLVIPEDTLDFLYSHIVQEYFDH